MTQDTKLNASGASHRRCVALLFGLAALLYAAGVSPHWRISPDSGRYLTMAHQLAAGKGYQFAGCPQWALPPALPAFYALVFRATSFTPSVESLTQRFTAVNAAGAVLGYLGLIAAYFLVREVAGVKAAIVVTALVAVSRYYFAQTFAILSDVPYSAATWTALCLAARIDKNGKPVHHVLFAVLLAVSVLLRLVGAALVASVVLYYSLRAAFDRPSRGKSFSTLIACTPSIAALLWLAIASFSARHSAAFSYYSMMMKGRSVWEVLFRFVRHLAQLPSNLFEATVGLDSPPGLSWALALLVAVGLVVLSKRGYALAALYFVVYLVLAATGVGLEVRLMVPLLPLTYLFGNAGIATIAGRFGRPNVRALAIRICLAVLVAANANYVARGIVQNFSDDFYAEYGHGKWQDYVLLAREIGGPRDGRVMVPAWGPVHMLAGWETVITPHVLDVIPEPERFLAGYVRTSGVRTVVLDPDYGGKRGAVLTGFMRSGPLAWKQTGRFGRLAVYVLDENVVEGGIDG